MAPPRKHDSDTILDAARALALRDGPRAVGVAAIARESGAPVGTLYHRFGNRDGVLSAAWLRALVRFQERALATAAAAPDPIDAGVTMARSIVGFARNAPEDARLLLVLRREDLLDADPDAAFKQRLDAINAPLEAAFARVARALGDGARGRDAAVRAVVDLPYAALRRHLRDDRPLPAWLEDDVAADARTLLSRSSSTQLR
jgi:AcrR family transcriptional regulator